ncbi:MAG: hypothetical protein ACYDA8_01775 [Deferrisomatales bacterium]
MKKVCEFVKASKVTPAVNQLDAFIKKVQQDLPKGKIGAADGTRLIGMANDLIGVLAR